MHTFTIPALILNTPTYAVKTLYSCLFHITRIYTSRYNANNPKIKFYFILYIFDTTENSHNNMNMKITVKVCTFFVY